MPGFGLGGISVAGIILRTQVLISPSTLVKISGMSTLPQFLLPWDWTPASSYSRPDWSSLTRGPPLSPLQELWPGLKVLAQ